MYQIKFVAERGNNHQWVVSPVMRTLNPVNARKYKTASAAKRGVEAAIRKTGIPSHFSAVIIEDDGYGVKKPYPSRLQLGERIFHIIKEAIHAEFIVGGPGASSAAAGNATESILKIVQNNYRRRRK